MGKLIDVDKYRKDLLLAYDDISMEFDVLDRQPTVDAIPRENIKLLGEELRNIREGIIDENVLYGFNIAVSICNKYLGESEDKK